MTRSIRLVKSLVYNTICDVSHFLRNGVLSFMAGWVMNVMYWDVYDIVCVCVCDLRSLSRWWVVLSHTCVSTYTHDFDHWSCSPRKHVEKDEVNDTLLLQPKQDYKNGGSLTTPKHPIWPPSEFPSCDGCSYSQGSTLPCSNGRYQKGAKALSCLDDHC